MLVQALIINGVVLFVVLESDLGSERRITWFRVARPLVAAALIVPFFIKGISTAGAGPYLEIALGAAGVVLGLLAATLMRVYRSPRTGEPVTKAGMAYAFVWVAVIGARIAFSYGSIHWFSPQLDNWMRDHAITSAALTDGLIFMGLAMVVVRVLAMYVRSRALPAPMERPTSPIVGGPTTTATPAGRESTEPNRTRHSNRKQKTVSGGVL